MSAQCTSHLLAGTALIVHTLLGAQGLIPMLLSQATGGAATQAITIGGGGDSYFEYLLKVTACPVASLELSPTAGLPCTSCRSRS